MRQGPAASWRVDVPGFEELGAVAFTTTREAGSFSAASDEPARAFLERWDSLRRSLGPLGHRFTTASQVHGARVVHHQPGWEGWLRCDGADGHIDGVEPVAMAVTIADCTPVFMAHPNGRTGILHAGWRGAAARIEEAGVRAMELAGAPADELHVHLGPSICGTCYEVGPEVHEALTGERVSTPRPIDVRGVLHDRLKALGVRNVTVSELCTLCDCDLFFSHRGGDAGRQVAVIGRTRGLGTGSRGFGAENGSQG